MAAVGKDKEFNLPEHFDEILDRCVWFMRDIGEWVMGLDQPATDGAVHETNVKYQCLSTRYLMINTRLPNDTREMK